MSEKLDLFKTLEAIRSCDFNYIKSLSPDQKKQISPLIYMGWLSGTNNKQMICDMNDICNNKVFSLYSHPDLLIKLLMASSSPGRERFKFIKFNNKKTKHPKSIEVIKRKNDCSNREAKLYLDLYKIEDLVEIAQALGESDEFIRDLKLEH